MIRLALTGSIGMGKSTTAAMFADEGVPVFDSDAAVHALYGEGGEAVFHVEQLFPGVTVGGRVDRGGLARRVTGDAEALARLEAIVHPLVMERRALFLREAERRGEAVVVLDIPLLFETGREGETDAVVVVTAPAEVQRERVLSRAGMDEAKFAALHARQVPDAEKRARADFVVDTSRGMEAAREQVRLILSAVRNPQFKAKAEVEGGGEPQQ
ncbi:MAG TPA: dephospho-CoA kinase [Caulobacteraceae bacterium]|jgi:dephospho-CoA kinase